MVDTEEVILVEIEGKMYETYIDENGVQRFPENDVIIHLHDKGKFDLNELAVDYAKGKIDQRDYLEFHMDPGYSIHGIWELSHFKDMEIKNPLWE